MIPVHAVDAVNAVNAVNAADDGMHETPSMVCY